MGAVHMFIGLAEAVITMLVLAVVVISIEGLPGETRVTLEWGVWSFAASVLLALAASILISSHQAKTSPKRWIDSISSET
jgi:hypothetical protein